MTAPAEGSGPPGLAAAAAAGIHCLPIPTPFAVGRVNTWLIEDDPLTLVDCGPNSAKTFDELELALAARGHRVEDLGLVFVTHQHVDHFGLAAVLARRAGAEIAALDLLVPVLADWSGHADEEDDFAEALMRRHGLHPDVVTAVRAVSSAYRGWGATVTVDRPLADGDALALRDRTLRVLHRPGHSATDTLLWDEERGLLLAADHLLALVSSNPLVTRPLEGAADAADRPRALMTYMDSLRATRDLPAEVVLPGHGKPVLDHRDLIESRLKAHERRSRRILRLLGEGPRTAHDIARELWSPTLAVSQAYLTLSEVLGHLDLLLERGQVEEREEGHVVRFHAVAEA